MARALLLGAHCDDLAFSLGGALFDGRFAPLQPVVVFSVSNYSRRHPPTAATVISRRRRQEERRFFRRVPGAAPPLFLDRRDAPLRLGIEPAATRRVRVPLADAAASLAADIAPLLRPGDRVLAPLALGGHIDHRLLHAAALRLPSCELLFYEDLPYAGETTEEEIRTSLAEIAAVLGGGLQPLLFPSPAIVPARQWAVRCYRSQIGAEELALLLVHPRRLGTAEAPCERLWRHRPPAGKEQG